MDEPQGEVQNTSCPSAQDTNLHKTPNAKFEFLQTLFNKGGDYKLHSMKNNLQPLWDNWKYYSACTEQDKTESNLREILPNELILDIDEPSLLAEIKQELGVLRWSYELWSTGSKGYHIRLEFPRLAELNEDIRKTSRKIVISHFGCDTAKQSGMLALENVGHFKTGKIKSLIESVNVGVNEFPEDTIKFAERLHKQLQERPKLQKSGKKVDLSKLPKPLNDVYKYGASSQRNKSRFQLILLLYSFGYSATEIESIILEFNARCKPPEDVAKVKRHIKQTIDGIRDAKYDLPEVVDENDGVIRPLVTPEPIEAKPEEVWDLVINWLKQHYWFRDEYKYHLAAYFILSTYCQDDIDTCPFLILYGNTVSGKTQLTNTVALLCHRPIMLLNPTVAAAYRIIDNNPGISFFVDEFTFNTFDKDPDTADMFRLYRGSFTRGMKIPRCETIGDRIEVVGYDCFCPKGFNTTKLEGLPDDMVNRSLTLLCMEPPINKRKDIIKLSFADCEEARTIRAKLSYLALNKNIELPDLSKFVTDMRLKDLGTTLARAASLLNKNDALIAYLDTALEERRNNLRESYPGMVLRVYLYLLERRITPTLANMQTAWAEVHELSSEGKSPTRKTIASKLRALGFIVKTTHTRAGDESSIDIEPESLDRLKTTHGICELSEGSEGNLLPLKNDANSSENKNQLVHGGKDGSSFTTQESLLDMDVHPTSMSKIGSQGSHEVSEPRFNGSPSEEICPKCGSERKGDDLYCPCSVISPYIWGSIQRVLDMDDGK